MLTRVVDGLKHGARLCKSRAPIRAVIAGAALLGCVALAACDTRQWPSATPLPTPAPSAGPSTSPSPSAGGSIVVELPTPAPVLCSPSPVSVPVGQNTIIACTSQGYGGPFTIALSNPGVASVQLASGTYTFYYVTGLATGTTTLTLTFPNGGNGTEAITVTP